MKKAIMYTEKAESLLMIISMVYAVIILFLQVILRYVFNNSLSWSEESARYMFIVFTWVGTSIAASKDRHIKVELLQTKLPKAKNFLQVICSVVCLLMSAFMLFYGIKLIQIMHVNVAVSPTMHIPMWICYMSVPLGGALLIFKYIYIVGQDIKKCFMKEVQS